jgi:hypothetical protein
VTDWTPVFLGVIAIAVLVMAAIQVGAVIYGARLARRVDRLASRVESEIAPVFAQMRTIGAEAARASALAAAQVERADRLFADVRTRVEQTVSSMQAAVAVPAREGLALMAALRATLAGLREGAVRPRSARHEDDDALFIG